MYNTTGSESRTEVTPSTKLDIPTRHADPKLNSSLVQNASNNGREKATSHKHKC